MLPGGARLKHQEPLQSGPVGRTAESTNGPLLTFFEEISHPPPADCDRSRTQNAAEEAAGEVADVGVHEFPDRAGESVSFAPESI